MSTLLINKNDFKDYKSISKGRDFDSIEQYIQEAQDLDLKDLMCRAFFYDIIKNYQEPLYQDLINGCTYTNIYGYEVEFKGIKPVLVYFAYARYIFRSHVSDTPFGAVQKTNEFSTPISSTEKRDIRDRYRTDAMQYWDEVKIYLNDKYQSYPKWLNCGGLDCHKCRKKNTGPFKMSVI